MNLETTIFNNLVYNEEYSRKVIPFLKPEYFNNSEKIVYNLIDSYVKTYNNIPTKEALLIELNGKDNISQEAFQSCRDIIQNLNSTVSVDTDWLLHKTEKFCQEKAVYNAIMESIHILDDKHQNKSKGIIPQILSDALAVSFDTNIGHDLLEDHMARYDFYHTKEVKIQFDLDYFNRITKGGISRKTLTVILAGTGVGKSLFMCHMAAANLLAGQNVLYITMEMAEERIAERIDSNIMDITIDELKNIPKENFDNRIQKLKNKTTGKLIIKEYPTACAGSANFRHLLNELKIKKKFVPHIIYIDYLNICMSSRMKAGGNVNS